MSKITLAHETKLETAKAENISAILDAKLEDTSPQRVTDYVSFSIDNLDATINRIKEAEAELKAIKKEAELQKALVKVEVSKWLQDTGIDSLKGDITSSMKITEPKPKENLIVTDEDALINQGYFKTVLDKTAVKNDILNGVNVEGASIEVEHQEDTITIYKKRTSKNDTNA